MTKPEVLVLVGLKGAGKSTAVRYLSAKGWPKVEVGTDVLTAARNLVAAGQKRMVIDGMVSVADLKELKREFPGEVKIVALVAPKKLRRQRMLFDEPGELTKAEVQECDRIGIEEMGQGEMIAAADEYIINDAMVGDLHARLEQVL